MTEPALSFLSLDVQLEDEEYLELEEIHATLGRLTQRRKDRVLAFGPKLLSPVAWNVVNYREAILYRVVATVGGAIVN